MLLLFGQHLTRIAALTTHAVSTVGEDTFLTLDLTPIPLPASLASLLADLRDMPAPTNWAANSSQDWLFPGDRPGQHLSATVIGRRLAAHQSPIGPPAPPPSSPWPRTCPQRSSGRCSASTPSPPPTGDDAPPPTGPPTSKPV